MLKEQLEKIGLAEKEAKVFLASLELGSDTIQNIATKAGVNRATTYVINEPQPLSPSSQTHFNKGYFKNSLPSKDFVFNLFDEQNF